MNKNMPIGIDDFRKARQDYYLVDKSRFIVDLIDKHSEVTLITRPRRFGKTLLMSMLNYFFSVDKKSESEPLFQGLAVNAAGEKYMAERGRYPVIFLLMKRVSGWEWKDIYGSFRLCMQDEFQRHAYLIESPALSQADKEFCRRMISLQGSLEDYRSCLLRLTNYLKLHFGQPVIILIDEYDAPIQCAYERGCYEQAVSFFRDWFNNGLKSNTSLHFAILTGVLRIAKESIFSGLNNLDVCSVLSDKYSDSCGFTRSEIEKMADELDFAAKLPEIKEWYDGYRIGSTEIYNPWSVVNYVSNDFQVNPFWVNTSKNSLLKDLLREASADRVAALYRLIEGGQIRIDIDESVIYKSIGKDDRDLYSMLLNTGYLTVADHSNAEDSRYALRIPNLEIRKVYHREILDTLTDTLAKPDFDRLIDDLLDGNTEGFEQRLSRILLSIASVYDTASESFYHGLMLGLTAIALTRGYILKSNRESGYGRFDLALIPQEKTKPAVLMEFKAADKPDALTAQAKTAIKQIADKKYEEEFSQLKCREIWKYGIAFCGKQVKVLKDE